LGLEGAGPDRRGWHGRHGHPVPRLARPSA
jgi:hypothetical protein